MAAGERIPLREMVAVELADEAGRCSTPSWSNMPPRPSSITSNTSWAGRRVTAGEFAGALEKVLRGFAAIVLRLLDPAPPTRVLESDLCRLAHESGPGRELCFFPRLRDELRTHLRQPSRMVRFRGLRGCVKQLAGARRWSGRCRTLEDEIVDLPARMSDRRTGPGGLRPAGANRRA